MAGVQEVFLADVWNGIFELLILQFVGGLGARLVGSGDGLLARDRVWAGGVMGALDALYICEDCKFQGIDTTVPGACTAPRTDSVAE